MAHEGRERVFPARPGGFRYRRLDLGIIRRVFRSEGGKPLRERADQDLSRPKRASFPQAFNTN